MEEPIKVIERIEADKVSKQNKIISANEVTLAYVPEEIEINVNLYCIDKVVFKKPVFLSI
jgi:hypothetical protein